MLRKTPRSESISDLIPQTLRELNKQYSKLELITFNLQRRDKDLFEICKSSLEKGQRERAIIYANEVAEIRKTLSVVTSTKLVLEQAIARLETIKEICPTMKELKGVFGNVKDVLKLLTQVMPVMTPEMDALNNVVTEILNKTQAESIPSIEPLVIKDASTEAIIQEAAGIVEEELRRKMPEPPMITAAPGPSKIAKAMIALTADGGEIHQNMTEDNFPIDKQPHRPTLKNSSSLSEELVLDYIYRNKGDMDITQCAKELGMSQNEILNVLDQLNTKGKIKIQR